MPHNILHGLSELRSQAFERMETDAEQYASTEHAMAIYVQEPLMAVYISQEREVEDLHTRSALMELGDDIIVYPDELTDLRLRAAYHGAGLATEPLEHIPRTIRNRLSDNLYNYASSRIQDYEQLYSPWTYRFKPGVLRKVLQHDFYIAACDLADGDLHKLSKESEENL